MELCLVGATELPGPTSFELESGVVPGGWIRLTHGDTIDNVVDPTGELATVPPPPDSNTPTEPPPSPPSPPTSDPAPVRIPESAPEPGPEPEAEFESFVLTPDRSTLREPLPEERAEAQSITGESTAEPSGDEESDDSDLVAGILCSRQHFNSPDSGYCSTCGISMVHQTHNLVHRRRPPLGLLVFDDGSTFTLDGRYLLGREPETDPLVQTGEARPIALNDPEMSVSRVHAELRLVDCRCRRSGGRWSRSSEVTDRPRVDERHPHLGRCRQCLGAARGRRAPGGPARRSHTLPSGSGRSSSRVPTAAESGRRRERSQLRRRRCRRVRAPGRPGGHRGRRSTVAAGACGGRVRGGRRSRCGRGARRDCAI